MINFFIFRHVITWGAGMFGQLGNGIRGDQRVSQNVSLPSDAAKVVQVMFTCSDTEHTLTTGISWVWSYWNSY